MFFVGVFGVESKEKKVAELNDFECKTNSCYGKGQIFKYYHYFHIFFIPVFRWGAEYYVKCNHCSGVFKITKEKGKEVEHGKGKITYWDLNEVRKGYVEVRCTACSHILEEGHVFCPKCGAKRP